MRRLGRSLFALGSAAALSLSAFTAHAQPAGIDGTAPATQPVAPTVTAPPTIGTVEVRIPASRSTTAPTKFRFNFKDAPIDTVLNYISAQAGFTVIKYDQIDARVTVVSEQPVSVDDAVRLLNTFLSVPGYTAIQEGKTLKVMTRSRAQTSNIPVEYGSDPDKIPPTDNLVTQVIPVKTVDAGKLKQNLQQQVSSQAILSADTGSNVIVLTDTQANVRRIVQIINSLDKRDPAESRILTRKLKNADAASAVKLIQDIFKTEGDQNQNSNLPPQVQFFRNMMSRRGGGGGFGGGGGGSPFGGGSPGGGGAESETQGGSREAKVTASSDARTNTIVVTGPQETLNLIEKEIIDKLDSDPISEQTFFLYPLKNAQAANLQSVLNSLFGSASGATNRSSTSTVGSNRLSSSSSGNSFGSGFGGGSSGGRGGSSGGFGGSSGFGSSSGSSGFGSSRSGSGSSSSSRGGFGGLSSTNGSSSLSGGSASTAAELQGQVYVVADTDTNSLLVATASKYQDQVRAIIAELDRPIPQVLIKVLIAEVTHENTDDLSFDFSILNQRAGTTTVGGVATPNGVTGSSSSVTTANQSGGLVVSLVEKNVQATLRALQVANKLDVLSRPYILATDNQPAEIVVGSEVPFVTDSNVTSLGTIVNTVQYRQIGIILDVTPHINPDGLVIMDVAPEISSQTAQFVPITQGVNAQVYTIRSANSRVGVKDGNTIVIGGLMEDRKTASLQKVPILGDIPLLGLLFQNNHVDKTKTELLIFMTPHVAQTPDFLKPMSQDEAKDWKLTPGAVQPGTFDDQIRGMQRGGANKPAGGNLIPANPPAPNQSATPTGNP